MARGETALALSDSDALVWATEASLAHEYFCACCGIALTLDLHDNVFKHPPSQYCSEIRSHQKLGLLYLHRILEDRQSCVQFEIRCPSCRDLIFFDPSGQIESVNLIVDEVHGEALMLETSLTLLLVMRPAKTNARKLAKALGAYWLEIDARNVLSGGPLAVLDSNLGDRLRQLQSCERCAAKRGQTHIDPKEP